MLYSLEKIIKALKINYKIYFILFVELTFCFTLTFLGINQAISRQNRERIMQEQTYNRVFIGKRSEKTMNPKDLQIIESSLEGDEQLIYLQHKPISLISDGSFFEIPSYLVNDTFIKLYLFEDYMDNNVYTTSDQFLTFIENNQLSFMNSKLTQKNNELYLDKDRIQIKRVDLLKEKSLVTSYNYQVDFDLSDSLFWPFKTFGDVINADQNRFMELMAVDNTTRNRQELINNMNHLTQNKYEFIDGQVIETYQAGVLSLSEMIMVFSFCGFVSLITLIVGIVSLLFIFMSKRRKTMVVSRLFGASYWQVYGELFVEVFILVMSASLLSGLTTVLLQPSLSSIYFKLEMTHVSLGAMIVLPVLICGITLGIVQTEIKEVYNLSVYK